MIKKAESGMFVIGGFPPPRTHAHKERIIMIKRMLFPLKKRKLFPVTGNGFRRKKVTVSYHLKTYSNSNANVHKQVW